MVLQLIGLLGVAIFIVFGLKHFLGLKKVDLYLKTNKSEHYQEYESEMINISTSNSFENKVAYEYIWGQRFKEHVDKVFIQLCAKTLRNGIYTILSFILIIVCM